MSVTVGAGRKNHSHILAKTHRWSNGWDSSSADHIFLTHRDLRDVLASYERVGWAFDIPDSYVTEHMRWRVRSTAFQQTSMLDPLKQRLSWSRKSLGRWLVLKAEGISHFNAAACSAGHCRS